MEPLNIHSLIFWIFFEELRGITDNLPSLSCLCLTWALCFVLFERRKNYVKSMVIKLSSVRHQVSLNHLQEVLRMQSYLWKSHFFHYHQGIQEEVLPIYTVQQKLHSLEDN